MASSIIGIDPGVVHTGCVRVTIDPVEETITRACTVIDGLDMQAAADWVDSQPHDLVVVEQYKVRKNFSADTDMLRAESEIKRLVPRIKVQDNYGIVKLVPIGLLQILGLWDYPMSTHHQDLRSAGRILVRGAVRMPVYNKLVADVVLAHLLGQDWKVGDWNA